MLAAVIWARRVMVARVAAAQWGVTTTFGISKSGLSSGRGSTSKTSSPVT